jgi:hypothetical protein
MRAIKYISVTKGVQDFLIYDYLINMEHIILPASPVTELNIAGVQMPRTDPKSPVFRIYLTKEAPSMGALQKCYTEFY